MNKCKPWVENMAVECPVNLNPCCEPCFPLPSFTSHLSHPLLPSPLSFPSPTLLPSHLPSLPLPSFPSLTPLFFPLPPSFLPPFHPSLIPSLYLLCGVYSCSWFILVVAKGDLIVVLLEPPLHPVLCALTLPAVPSLGSAHLLALSGDYMALLCGQSLQLWETKYYTCQQLLNTAVGSKCKVCGMRGALWVWCLCGM